MQITRVVAITVMAIALGNLMPSLGVAAEGIKLVKVVVKQAKSIQPKEAGGTTVEIQAVLTIKNNGPAVSSVSARQYTYDLFPKGTDGEAGEP